MHRGIVRERKNKGGGDRIVEGRREVGGESGEGGKKIGVIIQGSGVVF